ncbi:MAG: HEAT repeat domain-containing protein [Phycisphaerae bacterium]|nr:HEAT repeat domain-containing protein [Phycisphaerae bacterium]
MTIGRSGFVACVLAVALAAGCAAEPKPVSRRDRRGQEPAPVAPQAPAAPTGKEPIASLREAEPVAPLRASTLRERALTLIEESARAEDPQLRSNTMEFANLAAARMTAALAAGLADPSPAVRASALVTIGRSQVESLVDQIPPLVEDSSPFVRSSAVFALARLGRAADRSVSRLADLLFTDPSPRVRAHVAVLLGELGDASAAPMLREAAAVDLPRASVIEVQLLRLQIAEALVKLGHERELPTIRAALYAARPEDLEASALAVQIIGQLEDKGSTDHLVWLSSQRDEQGNPLPAEIQLAIASTLAQLGIARGDFIADGFAEASQAAIRAQAADVYGRIGQGRNLGKLERMMQDPSPLVRLYAAAGVLRTVNRAAGVSDR